MGHFRQVFGIRKRFRARRDISISGGPARRPSERGGKAKSKYTLLPKVGGSISVRVLDVVNLGYERRVHNSAKVMPLQVFG